MKLKFFSQNIFLILLLACLPKLANAIVWEDTETWSKDWENKYSQWIENEYTDDFFLRGHLKNIPIDCADAVYLPRLYFSYLNKLPFVIADLHAENSFYTNRTEKFDSMTDEIDRLRAFAIYIGDNVGASHIAIDTYPVAISKDNIRPGSVWSFITSDHIKSWKKNSDPNKTPLGPSHAANVKEISPYGVVNLIGSSSPREVKRLTSSAEFSILPNAAAGSGLRNWKWPEHYQMPEKDIPDYNSEQYSPLFARSEISSGKQQIQNGSSDVVKWSREAYKRLGSETEDKNTYLSRMTKNFCTYIQARVPIVLKGEELRSTLNDTCMNERQADDYSTPTRDAAIKKSLDKLVNGGAFFNSLKYAFGIKSKNIFESLRPYLEACGSLEIRPGYTVDFVEIARRAAKGKLSSDPNQSLEARWGEAPPIRNDCKY